jgi:hypothetical protein
MNNGYTKAFNELHARATIVVATKQTTWRVTQYKRVAIYIGFVLMAETVYEESEDHFDSPITDSMEWVHKVWGHKNDMLALLVQLNNNEWQRIKRTMLELASKSRGSEVWIKRRNEWITTLDTLWAFHH